VVGAWAWNWLLIIHWHIVISAEHASLIRLVIKALFLGGKVTRGFDKLDPEFLEAILLHLLHGLHSLLHSSEAGEGCIILAGTCAILISSNGFTYRGCSWRDL
jgi:hypothetical protein